MDDLLAHFVTAGLETCGCCEGRGTHPDGSECDRCDGSGRMHDDDTRRWPYCPGREGDEPAPKRRRHWREPKTAAHQLMSIEDLLGLHSDEALRRERHRAGKPVGHSDATRVRTLYDRKAAEMASSPAWQQLDEPIRSGTIDPVLLAGTGSGHTVVSEGGHRIVRAHQLGVSHLPVSWDPGSQAHRYDWDEPEPMQHEAVLPRPEYGPEPKYDFAPEDWPPEKRDVHNQRMFDKRTRWKAGIKRGLSLGHLTAPEAKAHGYYFGGHETDDRNEPKWAQLPHDLYHVTTDEPSVRRGGLKTRAELSQQRGGHGLGGGEDDTISFTTDRKMAHGILGALHEFHDVVNGRLTPRQMWDQAKAGHGASRPWHQDIARYYKSDWKDGDELPRGLHNTIHEVQRDNTMGSSQEMIDKVRGPGWHPAHDDEGWMSGHKPPQKMHAWWEKEMDPDQRRENAASFYKHFAVHRQVAGGAEDPMFFATDTKAFAAKDPRHFALLHVRPKPGAQGYPVSSMSEWRTGTGDAVQVHHAEHRGDLAKTGLCRQATQPYSMQHEGPDPGEGEGLHEIGSGKIWPKDFHERPWEYRLDADEESMAKVHGSRDWPGRKVWAYRALPSPHREVNTGDWVSTSRRYARQEGRTNSNPDDDYPVVKFQARAEHLRNEGNSLDEWSYTGPKVNRALVHFSGGANHRGKGGRGKTDAMAYQHEPEEMFSQYEQANRERREKRKAERAAREHTAVLPVPGLRNPHTGGDEWFHGSQAHREELKRGFSDPLDVSDEAFETPSAQPTEHWNSLLGTHFTADHDIAKDFATGTHGHGERPGGFRGIVHARLGIANPKVYDSEHDMDHEAYEHEYKAGNHPSTHLPLDSDDEDDRAEMEEMWPETHRIHQQFGNHEIWKDKIEGSMGYGRNPHLARTTWLTTHPDRWGIADRFRKRLQDQGHDGIIYGNEYEVSKHGDDANKSAIVFDQDKIHVTQHHQMYDDCDAQHRTAAAEQPVRLHRGLSFGRGSEQDIERLHSDPASLVHMHQGLGSHWTDEAGSAYNFALDRDSEGWPHEEGGADEGEGQVHGVVLHGEVHPRHIVRPGTKEWENYSAFSGVFDPGHAEAEVTVREHAPVRVTHLTAVHVDPQGYEHETRHSYGQEHQAARRKPLQPDQEECWKCGVRDSKETFTKASPYAPVMGLAMECTDKDACRQRREGRRTAANYRGKFRCKDCGWDTNSAKPGVRTENYAVHSDVWHQAGMDKMGGNLCVGCLEKRLGRQLHSGDFPAVPVNDLSAADTEHAYTWRTDRLKDRIQRTAGQRGDLPELEYYHVLQGREKGGYHAVAAAHDGQIIGHLTWGPGRTKINRLWVHPQYRRHGVADALYQRSKWVEPGLQHHTDRTEAGDAWARSVSDEVPEHLDDTTSGDADRKGAWAASQFQQRLDSGHRTMKRLAAGARTTDVWHSTSPWKAGLIREQGFNVPAVHASDAPDSEFMKVFGDARVHLRLPADVVAAHPDPDEPQDRAQGWAPMDPGEKHYAIPARLVRPEHIVGVTGTSWHSCPDCEPGSNWRDTPHGQHTAAWVPSARIFGPTYGLDRRLFTAGEELKPGVRQALLGRLQGVLEPVLGQHWDAVTRVYLAGSEASRWTSPELVGNGDLDVLIGVAYSYARQEAPHLAGLTDVGIDKHLNAALQQQFNAPGWHPPFGPEDTYDLTGYCNNHALDIRAINPYAAYDLTNDEWAVKPPDLPDWSAEQFPQGPAVMQEARALIAQVRAVLRLPEPFRTQEATRIWDSLHQARGEAFSAGGLGWQGTGNVLEKALDQASGKLVEKLKQLKYGPADHAPVALGHGMTTANLDAGHGSAGRGLDGLGTARPGVAGQSPLGMASLGQAWPGSARQADHA